MAQTPEQQEAAMVANLKQKTGKALPEWLGIVRASGAEKHGEIVAHLKSRHGMTHGFANLVAHKARAGGEEAGGEALVAAQFAGEKAALKPIYDALVRAVRRFGADVEIAPKKTCVSLRRHKQFALVQASTRTRLDVGLNLKGRRPSGRLEAAGSFSGMCSHRVRLATAAEVDAELLSWLEEAYAAS